MTAWRPRATVPALGARAVHVWRCDMDVRRDTVDWYRSLLTSDELERAARFRVARDRERFVTCRGVLRQLLAGYRGVVDPRAIRLAYGASGKPSLADSGGTGGALRFNVSHAGGLALLAFTRSVELGVDIEREHDLPDLEPMMRSHFAPGERQAIGVIKSPVQRRAAFFRCWTRKEAILKALGVGLGLALDSFEVSVTATSPVRLRWRTDAAYATTRWRGEALRPARGYPAAVAYAGPSLTRACWSYDMVPGRGKGTPGT